jgi:hypothetical protein
MSAIGKRVIFVGPADGSNHKPLNIEGVAVAAVLPGTFLKRTAAGLDVNDIAAIIFGEQFIIADKDQQRSKSVDTAWTINENMVAIAPRSGEFVNALVATGQTLIKGSPMARNGAGLLKLAVTPATVGATSEEIVAYSDEVITTTGTILVCVRIA